VQQVIYSIDGAPLPFVDQIRDIGVYHNCRLKYDVHNAYKRAVLILKCFHTRERDILKLAFITYVRPLLEFSCQVWAPKYNYLIDKIESVQRFFLQEEYELKNFAGGNTPGPPSTGGFAPDPREGREEKGRKGGAVKGGGE